MHELDEQVPQKKRKRKSDKQIPGAKQSASGFFAHKWDEEKEAGPKQFKIGTWTMDEDAMVRNKRNANQFIQCNSTLF